MIRAFAALAMTASFAAMPGLAAVHVVATDASGFDLTEHGGGCRKDSPPGKCCHAGSQPYHCH